MGDGVVEIQEEGFRIAPRDERVGFLRSRTRQVGLFDYRVSLPTEVDEDKVTASLADGVLTVRVPKTERARQRKIPINTGW